MNEIQYWRNGICMTTIKKETALEIVRNMRNVTGFKVIFDEDNGILSVDKE